MYLLFSPNLTDKKDSASEASLEQRAAGDAVPLGAHQRHGVRQTETRVREVQCRLHRRIQQNHLQELFWEIYQTCSHIYIRF
jgi:hypothetical protein